MLTDNEILNNEDNKNIKKRKKSNMPSLPKIPSTLFEKSILSADNNTSTIKKMKIVKKIPVLNKCTIATSFLEDRNVEKENRHSLNLNDKNVCEIPEKRKKLLLSENSSKHIDNEEENECSTMKQSASTLSSRKSLFTKNLNTLLLTRNTNNTQESNEGLSLEINLNENGNNTFNENCDITNQNNVSNHKKISNNSSLSSTTDEKIIYLIGNIFFSIK